VRLLRPLAVALVAGCATTAADEPTQATHALVPYAVHEECAKLAPGDRIDYTFQADAAIHFNIHYHDGPAVVEPVTRERVTADAGVFVAALAHDYCLMWEAGAAPAMLDYRMRVRRADR
jgi:hypothetical protein